MVGRKEETRILEQAIASDRAEMIAIFGRRRVGKTFMIRHVLQKHLAFEFSGTLNASAKVQLSNFAHEATRWFALPAPMAVPGSWQEALVHLSKLLEPQLRKKPTAVFFDELPWINGRRSGFLAAFDYWWNTWASRQPRLTVVLCGSATAWMIKHVVNHKGGLHNRITRSIRLTPFTLAETEAFLHARNIQLPRYQIAQLYMCTGGVPHYLAGIARGQSATQAIQQMCFSKNGLLTNEFDNLYDALFENADKHISVVKALAEHPGGLSRSALLHYCKLSTGGGTTRLLSELLESGFISYQPIFGKAANEGFYHLEDAFTHFYYRFMAGGAKMSNHHWESMAQQAGYLSWAGYAFERMCTRHIEQVKQALQIGGVATTHSCWRSIGKDGKSGAQIDLIIDRNDQCIHLCEIKFAQTAFVIDKGYALKLQQKEQAFRLQTQTRKALFTTFITPFGVADNAWKPGSVHSEIVLDDLF